MSKTDQRSGVRRLQLMDHFSAASEAYVEQVVRIWQHEYRVDGFRFDGAHLIGWDEKPPRGRGLYRMSQLVAENDPGAYQLAEHHPVDPTLMRLTSIGASYATDLRNILQDSLQRLRRRMLRERRERLSNTTIPCRSGSVACRLPATSDSGLSFVGSQFTDLLDRGIGLRTTHNFYGEANRVIDRFDFPSTAVKYLRTHDHPPLMYDLLWIRLPPAEARLRHRLYTTMLLLGSGVPLVFQGDEFARNDGWRGGIANSVKMDYRPVPWHLIHDGTHREHLDHFRDLLRVRHAMPAAFAAPPRLLGRWANAEGSHDCLLAYAFFDAPRGGNVSSKPHAHAVGTAPALVVVLNLCRAAGKFNDLYEALKGSHAWVDPIHGQRVLSRRQPTLHLEGLESQLLVPGQTLARRHSRHLSDDGTIDLRSPTALPSQRARRQEPLTRCARLMRWSGDDAQPHSGDGPALLQAVWVTLLVGSSVNTSMEVEMQVRSVRRFSRFPHTTLVLGDSTGWDIRNRLAAVGSCVIPVKPIPPPWPSSNKWWSDVFAKLHVWRLTFASRAVFLDTDVLLSQFADSLFDECLADFCAVPDNSLQRNGELMINAGVMVIQPSLRHWEVIRSGLAAASARHVAGGDVVRGGLPEQEFLSEFYAVSHRHREFNASALRPAHGFSFMFVDDAYNSCTPRYFWQRITDVHGADTYVPCCHDNGCDFKCAARNLDSARLAHGCGPHKFQLVPLCVWAQGRGASKPTSEASGKCASKTIQLAHEIMLQSNPCSELGRSSSECVAKSWCKWCGDFVRCVPADFICHLDGPATKLAEKRAMLGDWHGYNASRPPNDYLVILGQTRKTRQAVGDWIFVSHHKSGTTVGSMIARALCLGSGRTFYKYKYRERVRNQLLGESGVCHYLVKVCARGRMPQFVNDCTLSDFSTIARRPILSLSHYLSCRARAIPPYVSCFMPWRIPSTYCFMPSASPVMPNVPNALWSCCILCPPHTHRSIPRILKCGLRGCAYRHSTRWFTMCATPSRWWARGTCTTCVAPSGTGPAH